ncbi:MAG: phosphopentomutase [Leptospiraceae bacterium]|nr:phosphopentomutase [Leptospiraceae bacterium]
MEIGIRKIVVLVLDSLGVGEQPDSYFFNDRGRNTVGHVADTAGGLKLPNLEKLGFGNLTYTKGVERNPDSTGFYGKMRSQANAKDSVSGHWELCGLITTREFNTFYESVPEEFLAELSERTEKEFLVITENKIEDEFDAYGVEHQVSGKPILICYRDSRVMVTGHTDVLSEIDMYILGENMREIADAHYIATVGSIFFDGQPGDFMFKEDTIREFIMPSPGPTLIDAMYSKSIPIIGIGKIADIYATSGLTDMHRPNGNAETIEKVRELILDSPQSENGQVLIFANLPDLDSLYGHKGDALGYAKCLEEIDELLPRIIRTLRNEDVLFICADHGLDPTGPDQGHTREHVPVLAYSRLFKPQGKGDLGVRKSYADLAETIAEAYDLNVHYAAESFWSAMVAQL